MVEPIRVLEVLASGAIGGGASHLENLAKGLDPERFVPEIATSGSLLQTLSEAGIKVLGLPSGNARAMKELARAMRGVQLVHAHGTRSALWAAPGARLHRVPLLYTVHGWSFHPRRFRLTAAWLEGILARQCRHVVCVSHEDRRQGLDCGILELASSRVIPNGIDLARFNPSPTMRLHVRERLGVKSGGPLIGFCGRLTPQKAPELFVMAAYAVLSRCPEATFLMIGDGPERKALETLVSKLGIASRLHFLGERRDVETLLPALDCFVLPSRWEGLPIALLEAMAAGVPSIATAVNGSRELIRHGETGWLVPPDHLADLIGAIFAVLADPVRSRGIAQAARAQAERAYSLPFMLESVQVLYQEVSTEHARCWA